MSAKGRIAILGAGAAGVCCALELASRGYFVDLYEQEPGPLRRASRVNEGKIHLGLLYARDDSFQTSELMIHGALTFAELLRRWMGGRSDHLHLSEPFLYGVHRDTMVPVSGVAGHFDACLARVGELSAATGYRYLERDTAFCTRRLGAAEVEDLVDPGAFPDVFETPEYAVDPRRVCAGLSDALANEPAVTFLGAARVTGVLRGQYGGFKVLYDDGESREETGYSQVVNCLWEGRLVIDRQLGLPLPAKWSHRHKFGSRVRIMLSPDDVPSITAVLGPFGDLVNFGAEGLFLSWYPSGMVSMTGEIEPARNWCDFDRDARMDVFRRSRAVWSGLSPKLASLEIDEELVDPVSGQIFAFGNTDIDDESSALHARYRVGVQSAEGYHSVNTGKFTLAPLVGLKAADRVSGIETELCGLGRML